jgi:nucleotide-binding universal stress UspA family protein
MNTPNPAPVVVGIDDFDDTTRLVTAAALEARVRKAPLWLVHAYQWIPPVALGLPPAITAEDAVLDATKALLEKTAEQLDAENPGLEVRGIPSGGRPATVLADLAGTASLLVVGGRGRGGFTGQLLGSVALGVIARAQCPVMVVRGEHTGTAGRITVGIDVDAPATGREPLEFAVREAELRGARLHAVNAWEYPAWLFPSVEGKELRTEFADLDALRHRRLDEALAPWTAGHDTVEVSGQVLAGSPAKVLIEAGAESDLIVLGGKARTHGHGGMQIGVLAQNVLHHAQCSVIVVPEH